MLQILGRARYNRELATGVLVIPLLYTYNFLYNYTTSRYRHFAISSFLDGEGVVYRLGDTRYNLYGAAISARLGTIQITPEIKHFYINIGSGSRVELPEPLLVLVAGSYPIDIFHALATRGYQATISTIRAQLILASTTTPTLQRQIVALQTGQAIQRQTTTSTTSTTTTLVNQSSRGDSSSQPTPNSQQRDQLAADNTQAADNLYILKALEKFVHKLQSANVYIAYYSHMSKVESHSNFHTLYPTATSIYNTQLFHHNMPKLYTNQLILKPCCRASIFGIPTFCLPHCSQPTGHTVDKLVDQRLRHPLPCNLQGILHLCDILAVIFEGVQPREVRTQDILHFLPYVLNGVEIWAVRWVFKNPDTPAFQPFLRLARNMDTGIVLKKKSTWAVVGFQTFLQSLDIAIGSISLLSCLGVPLYNDQQGPPSLLDHPLYYNCNRSLDISLYIYKLFLIFFLELAKNLASRYIWGSLNRGFVGVGAL